MPADGIEGIVGLPPRAEECTVYVSLEPDADGVYWHRAKVSVHRPASGKFLRGVCRRGQHEPARLQFGIETFYVPEGTGQKYEQAARARQLAAQIAVAPWGNGKLRSLQIR